MFKKINLFFTKYKHLSRKINDIITIKNTLKATSGALLISVLIILIPSLIVYNLYIFYKLRTILTIIIILIVFLFSFIFNYFYDQIVKNYHPVLNELNTKIVYLTDTIIAGIIISLVTVIIVTAFV